MSLRSVAEAAPGGSGVAVPVHPSTAGSVVPHGGHRRVRHQDLPPTLHHRHPGGAADPHPQTLQEGKVSMSDGASSVGGISLGLGTIVQRYLYCP